MNQTVQKITQRLINHLPENDQYYRLDELRSWGFPTFVVRRIKIELQRNLEESMIIPKTDWANIQSDAVLDAWQKFVEAIRAEARLPASYAKAVIETAVADVIEILVQPRKYIPEVVFGADDELSYTKMVNRSRTIVVYPHFANLLPRYMQKKDLETLSKKQCSDIIAKADQRITARYSPLNWAQMMEPLFKLLDGSIDTNLLRLFFEDKNLPRIARQFDLMDKSLTRAEVIEVLSSPELLNFEGYEDDQPNLFDVKPKKSKKQPKPEPGDIDLRKPEVDLKVEYREEPKSEDPENRENRQEKDIVADDDNVTEKEEEQEPDFSLNAGFTEMEEEPDNEEEEDGSLNAAFLQQESEAAEDEDEWEETEQESAEKDQKPELKGESENSDPDEETEPENEDSDATIEREETPMWMRYMSDEEVEEYERSQQEGDPEEEQDPEENVDEDGFIDEPIIDLTKNDATKKEIKALREQFSGDRELFVEEIFNGSDRAFDEAVENIAAYDRWREVSKFIEKNIFKRNLIDMYSEKAVDFTDRLQSYFLEKKNRNR
ncbi:MAG TPA: hypothetical protein VJ964_09290 [Balneolaceae bacterium]|nr:hypothetical protein [Balneolaceae bacterium]